MSEWPRQDQESRKARGKNGWAPSDCWNIDTYISGVLAGMLPSLKHAGHPTGMTEKEWFAILDEMIEGFSGWEKHYDFGVEEENKAYEAVRKSLKLLRKHFGSLWD